MHPEKENRREITIHPSKTQSLQEQIICAQREGISRIFLEGVFEPHHVHQFSLLTITHSLELMSKNGATLDGRNRATHLLYVADGVTITVSGITFTRGNTDSLSAQISPENHPQKKLNIYRYLDGGAITMGAGSVVKLENCVFTHNHSAICGAAISNLGGYLDVNNCSFSDNSSGDTGAVIDNLAPGSLAIVDNSTFKHNDANQLGAGTFGAITAFPYTYLVVLNSDFSKEKGPAIDYQSRLRKKSLVYIESCKFNKNAVHQVVMNPVANYGSRKEILRRFLQIFVRKPHLVELARIPAVSSEIKKKHLQIFYDKISNETICNDPIN